MQGCGNAILRECQNTRMYELRIKRNKSKSIILS